jgi:hypothetical protein
MSMPSSRCQNCGHTFASFGEKVCPGCGRVRVEKTMTGASSESYTVKRRDGSEIGPVPLEAVRQMLDQGAIDRDTPIRVGSTGKVVFPDQLPPPPKATTFPTPKPAAAPSKRPKILFIAAAVLVVLLCLAFSVSALRDKIASRIGSGTPATVIGGELAASKEDLLAFEKAAPMYNIGGGERARELIGDGSPGDPYTRQRLEQDRRVTRLLPIQHVEVLSRDEGACFVRVTDEGINQGLTGYVLARKMRGQDGESLDPNVRVPHPGDFR